MRAQQKAKRIYLAGLVVTGAIAIHSFQPIVERYVVEKEYAALAEHGVFLPNTPENVAQRQHLRSSSHASYWAGAILTTTVFITLIPLGLHLFRFNICSREDYQFLSEIRDTNNV